MASIVALHGFTGDSRSWEAVVGRLRETPEGESAGEGLGEVRCPTLLGHGGVDPRVADLEATSFDAEVDRLASDLEGLPEPRILAGYSLGARVGLGLLVRHGGLFASALLVGVHPGLVEERERVARRESDEAWAQLLEREGIDSFVARWQSQPLFASQQGLPSRQRELHRDRRLAHDAPGLARSLRALGLGAMPSRWDDLSSLDLPVILMTGGLDAKFRRIAGQAAALLPWVAVESVPDVGHDLLLEAPGTVVAGLGRLLKSLP